MQALGQAAAYESKANQSDPGCFFVECACWHLAQPPTDKDSMRDWREWTLRKNWPVHP
jgi:hypothetical protein